MILDNMNNVKSSFTLIYFFWFEFKEHKCKYLIVDVIVIFS